MAVLKKLYCVRQMEFVLSYATLNFDLRFAYSYCARMLLFYIWIHTFQVFFNANPIQFICVLKFCVLNINAYLQFADTIILNIGAQLRVYSSTCMVVILLRWFWGMAKMYLKIWITFV